VDHEIGTLHGPKLKSGKENIEADALKWDSGPAEATELTIRMAIQKLWQLQSIFEEVLPLLKFGELKEFSRKKKDTSHRRFRTTAILSSKWYFNEAYFVEVVN
jgi:hypothetical protein